MILMFCTVVSFYDITCCHVMLSITMFFYFEGGGLLPVLERKSPIFIKCF